MSYDPDMSPVVIWVGCDVCGAAPKSPCVGDPEEIGMFHGARLDAFCADGPLEARVLMHVESLEAFATLGVPSDGRTIFLDDEETAAVQKGVTLFGAAMAKKRRRVVG